MTPVVSSALMLYGGFCVQIPPELQLIEVEMTLSCNFGVQFRNSWLVQSLMDAREEVQGLL